MPEWYASLGPPVYTMAINRGTITTRSAMKKVPPTPLLLLLFRYIILPHVSKRLVLSCITLLTSLLLAFLITLSLCILIPSDMKTNALFRDAGLSQGACAL